MLIKGIVERIYENQTRAGTTYKAMVNGQGYGMFKTKPTFREGDAIEFMAKQNGQYWNMETRTLKVVASSEITPPTTASGSTGYSGSTGKRQFYKKDPKEQEVISKQAASNTAISFMNMAVAAGAVAFPKTAKEKDKFEVLMNMTKQVAADFYELHTGLEYGMDGVKPSMSDEEAFVDGVEEAEANGNSDRGW